MRFPGIKLSVFKKLFIIASLVLCLYPAKHFLGSQPYPLLMEISASDSDNASNIYSKINQIHAAASAAAGGALFKISNSAPNFESYSICINHQGARIPWPASEILVKPAPDSLATVEIKARNRLGGESGVFTFSLSAGAMSAETGGRPALEYSSAIRSPSCPTACTPGTVQ